MIMERVKVAYWINELGEDVSSRVLAEFSHGETHFLVVHDWREGMRGQGFIVLDWAARDVLVRMETPK
jgi:hypothetical protein